jgi:F0F1-type ATP synthase membrane subunit b/b'
VSRRDRAHGHAKAILEHELRRARKQLVQLPEQRRSALEEEIARVVAALVDAIIEESRREPSLARALVSIYGPEPAREPRVVSWAAD